LFGGFFCAAAWFAMASGCSSKDDAGPAAQDASLTCPPSVAEAAEGLCTHEGQDCPIGYACGSFAQQAHCVCTKGQYACTDATGAVVAKGAEPVCVGFAPPANPAECPASESSAGGRVCRTAGLLCYYTGVQCPGSATPFIDHCQCVGSALTDSGLAFKCEPNTCNPRSDASDDAYSPPDTGPVEDAGQDG
jgi:hypothetical protein